MDDFGKALILFFVGVAIGAALTAIGITASNEASVKRGFIVVLGELYRATPAHIVGRVD